jgi:hypothetical protein
MTPSSLCSRRTPHARTPDRGLRHRLLRRARVPSSSRRATATRFPVCKQTSFFGEARSLDYISRLRSTRCRAPGPAARSDTKDPHAEAAMLERCAWSMTMVLALAASEPVSTQSALGCNSGSLFNVAPGADEHVQRNDEHLLRGVYDGCACAADREPQHRAPTSSSSRGRTPLGSGTLGSPIDTNSHTARAVSMLGARSGVHIGRSRYRDLLPLSERSGANRLRCGRQQECTLRTTPQRRSKSGGSFCGAMVANQRGDAGKRDQAPNYARMSSPARTSMSTPQYKRPSVAFRNG